MITSAQISLLSELREKPISKAALVEMEARLQSRIHSMILDAFNRSGLSRKELAERLDWDNARISRLLGSPTNLTLGTISALLSAIGVDFDDPTYTGFDELEKRLRTPLPKMQIRHSGVVPAISNQMNLPLDVRSNSKGGLLASTPTLSAGTTKGLQGLPRNPPSPSTKVIPFDRKFERELGENRRIEKLVGENYA